jgi:non-homologous end joining protein Ku
MPTLKKYSKNIPENDKEETGKIVQEKIFTEIDDPEQKAIEFNKQAKAFYYGKQLVPVSSENEHVLKHNGNPQRKKKDDPEEGPSAEASDKEFKGIKGDEEIAFQQQGATKCFKLLGFTHQDKVPRHNFMAGVDLVLPIKGSKNEKAFAAMVSAMIDTKKVLLAKIMMSARAEPRLVVLYPHVSNKQPLLYMVQLPTAEDLRDYQFPSLVQSTNKQREAAKNLIEKLDLCQQEENSDGELEEVERLKVEKTFNPSIQYFNQVVTHKVINPQQANVIPEMDPVIKEYLEPDQEL